MKEFSDEYEVCPYCGYICDPKGHKKGYFLQEGTVLLERYYIGIVLGCGGFGITYKAYDMTLDVIIAIKEYYPQGMVRRSKDGISVEACIKDDEREYRLGKRRFLAEARTMARFSKHDNIVNVYNYFERNQTAYIVMEFLDGLTLKLFLDNNNGVMSVNDSIWVIKSTAKALCSLHESGILHRDVSPDNIFLCRDGRVKLIDFGAARLLGTAESTGKVVVKVGYAPPEQYSGNEQQGSWTDMYALGASFYRALTGIVPVESLTRLKDDYLKSPKEYGTENCKDIPEYYSNAIMKLLMIEPEDRFSDADEFLDVMESKKTIPLITSKEKSRRKLIVKRLLAAWLMIMPLFIVMFSWWISRR